MTPAPDYAGATRLPPLLPVTTAAQSAASDADAIAHGTPSRALMQRAGAAAAAEIALRYGERLERGVLVLAGPGNNGGDGWVVARALQATGVPVRVVSPLETKTDDARFERALCHPERSEGSGHGTQEPGPLPSAQDDNWREPVIIDALLGTGASGAPRGALADAIASLKRARDAGATIVALDLPSGLDATTGDATHAVPADLTLTFGTIKRGHLVARGACGRIAVLDIGLDPARDAGEPRLVDARWVSAVVPPITADAHKGTRRKLAIIGGAAGMAGAAILAARAAMRSGVGMVKLVVAPDSMNAVQRAEPLALAAPWPQDDESLSHAVTAWADALVIGPGLGNSAVTRALVERVLRAWRGPVVIDADGLNVFADDLDALAALLGGRPALLTPHPAEAARLAGGSVESILATRFDAAAEIARRARATVLLKGVPTLVSDGARTLVSAAGSPVLATAGSGDLLSGIAGTLVAQVVDPLHAGAAAAWVHGRAAELAGETRVRGMTLEDVLEALPGAWPHDAHPTRYPVLLELPPVGER